MVYAMCKETSEGAAFVLAMADSRERECVISISKSFISYKNLEIQIFTCVSSLLSVGTF